MAKRKCVCCGEWIEAGEASIPFKGRYAHQKCFNIAIKTLQQDKVEKLSEKQRNTSKKKSQSKPKAELKEALSEQEYVQKKQYYQYLHKLLNSDTLSAKIYALSNDFISKYGFTFQSMYQTLVYLHEIAEKELTGDIVGIIPYYHTEAQQYFDSVKNVEELNKEVDVSDMYHTKTIKLKTRNKKIKQLDIETIGKEVG